MRAEVLTELLQRQPFPLLRPDGPSQREAVINLLHIIWIEIITPPT